MPFKNEYFYNPIKGKMNNKVVIIAQIGELSKHCGVAI